MKQTSDARIVCQNCIYKYAEMKQVMQLQDKNRGSIALVALAFVYLLKEDVKAFQVILNSIFHSY